MTDGYFLLSPSIEYFSPLRIMTSRPWSRYLPLKRLWSQAVCRIPVTSELVHTMLEWCSSPLKRWMACILPFFIPEDCVEGAVDNKIVFVLIICGYLTHVFGNLPIVIGGKFGWGGRTVSIDNIGEFFAVHINVPAVKVTQSSSPQSPLFSSNSTIIGRAGVAALGR